MIPRLAIDASYSICKPRASGDDPVTLNFSLRLIV